MEKLMRTQHFVSLITFVDGHFKYVRPEEMHEEIRELMITLHRLTITVSSTELTA